MYKNRKVTVIIPALNEELSIANVVNGLFNVNVCAHCLNVIKATSEDAHIDSDCNAKTEPNTPRHNVDNSIVCPTTCNSQPVAVVDQIIVADNGSTDETAAIAATCGALVVEEPERGYGAACLAALAAPEERDLVVFVDGDHSVVAHELPSLLHPLCNGADLVIGSRTLGQCEKGALSIPQEFGNKLAIALMKLLWRRNVTDLGPFRAATHKALTSMHMSDRKFGWTVEMQIRAFQLSLTTVEVPVTTLRRIGKSKISGTVSGVIGAAHGILGTIGKLYWRQITKTQSSSRQNETYSVASQMNEKSEKSS